MLPHVVAEAAQRFGEAPALATPDGWAVSYNELHRLSDEVAAGLAERGVHHGDLVALSLPSTPDYVVAYLALAKLGAVTVGVNPRLAPAERTAALEVVHPDLALTTADLAAGLPAGLSATVVPLATDPGSILEELRSGHGGAAPPPLPPDPDRAVAVVLTSGTTGRPKGALFTNRQLTAITALDVGDRWGGGGPMLASTQFAHVGFMTKLPWYLRLGGTIHLLHRWRARHVLELVERTRMASIGGVAPQIALLLREPTFDERDLSCVKTLVVGGAASPPALVREARERFGAAYSIRYSSTESGGVGLGTAFDADDHEALHTVGHPRPGVEISLRDEADRPVADGEIGELCLRSGAVMAGYWNDPEATAATLAGGWLRSGDLARIDEKGCVVLAGRSKEMFIRGGYNVYPIEVEAVLGQHPAVADVAVVPRPDAVMGEVGVAVVVPRPGATAPSLAELRAFAAERLAKYKLPEALELVDALPLTPMQKLDRRALTTQIRHAAP
jgi:acyl-CoA synthetase (AMP-forming)/AMP-acid ligase II